jgi:competence protein ComGC
MSDQIALFLYRDGEHRSYCLADNGFGTVIRSAYQDNSDFTLMFEQSILLIVPSIIFLLMVPIKLYPLHGATAKTVSNHMRSCKAVSSQLLSFEMR